MIKLIATDMDGTLLDDEKRLPPDFSEVMDRLKRHDIRFTIASGRSYSALTPIFEPYSEKMSFICDNGAFIVQNGKEEFISSIASETVSRIVRICRDKIPEAYPVLCGRRGIYAAGGFSLHSEKELGFYYNSRQICDDLANTGDDIFKIAIYDENDPKTCSYPVLDKIFGKELTLVVSGHLWMDIMNPGINKGAALNTIQKSLGISKKETMAFGDFYNDIDLLAQAEYSYVMDNANDDMKLHGKYIAGSNNSGGVTRAIKQYLDENGLF